MPKVPRKPYHHGNLRAELVKAGAQLIEQTGEAGLSLRALSRTLGVSHAAPTHHFGDRDGLFAAIAADGYARLASFMSEALRDAPGQAALGAIGVAYVRFATAHPHVFRLMFGPRSALWGERDSAALVESERCQQILQGAVAAAYGAPAQHPAEAASGPVSPFLEPRALSAWALVHGLATLWIDRALGEPSSALRDEFERTVVIILCAGGS